MRILISGDRNWFKKSIIRQVLSQYDPKSDIIIHGGANGADNMAGEIAKELGWPDESILVFPADWENHGKKAGPIRNRQMLKEGKPDFLHAFHSNIEESKGTKDMIQAATEAGIPYELHP